MFKYLASSLISALVLQHGQLHGSGVLIGILKGILEMGAAGHDPWDIHKHFTANTSPLVHGKKLYALHDLDLPYKVSSPTNSAYSIMERAQRKLTAINSESSLLHLASCMSQHDCIEVLSYDPPFVWHAALHEASRHSLHLQFDISIVADSELKIASKPEGRVEKAALHTSSINSPPPNSPPPEPTATKPKAQFSPHPKYIWRGKHL